MLEEWKRHALYEHLFQFSVFQILMATWFDLFARHRPCNEKDSSFSERRPLACFGSPYGRRWTMNVKKASSCILNSPSLLYLSFGGETKCLFPNGDACSWNYWLASCSVVIYVI